MPPELAENLAASGATAAVSTGGSAIAKNAPPGGDVDGFSESLIGWIPEESRVAAMPKEEKSKAGLIIAAAVAALVVGGGGVAAAVMMGGDDEPEVAKTEPKDEAPPAEEEPTVAAIADGGDGQEEPASDHEPEIVLDEDDLVLDPDEPPPEEKPAGPVKTKKKSSSGTGGGSSRPAIKEPTPSGPVVNLSAGMVRREIASNMFHVHRCYDGALKADPTLKGRYSITITIGISGKVTRVVIDKDTLGHPGVAKCVKRKVKAWRFPIKGRLSEPTEVGFPVKFTH